MIITAIEEQQKNKDRVNVFVDGVFAFGLKIDLVWEHRLKIGREVTKDQVAEIKNADAFAQAYDRAVGYIARRPRSKQEMRTYLRDKLVYHHPDMDEMRDGPDKETFISEQLAAIERIMTRLEERQLLDDVAFAKWWIDNRRAFRPRGTRLLLVELKAKGVSNDDLHAALTTPSDEGHFKSEVGEGDIDQEEYSEVAAALKIAQKYVAKYHHLPEADWKKKTTRYLMAKGFDWDTIEEVLKKLTTSQA